MSMGASTGSARLAASVAGYARIQTPGTDPVPGQMIRAFPGTEVPIGSAEFWIWAIFWGSLAYVLGVHWLLGSARRVIT